jgi:hypothetical protein
MQINIAREVAALGRMTTRELRARYADVFGETTPASNKAWLIKRIAWRLQAQAEGDLSERARQRAAELANDADLRLSPPKVPVVETRTAQTATDVLPSRADDRLPPPGTILARPYKGQMLQVKVLANGFEFEGEVFRSLSAVAKAVTGSHCNGFLFFRLGQGAAS